MKTEVSLLVDTVVLEKAEIYAAKKGLTMQDLFEKYLTDLTSPGSRKNILDLIAEMKTTTSIPPDADLKDLYFKEQAAKYGF